MESTYRKILNQKGKDELKIICKKLGITRYSKLQKNDLVTLILGYKTHPKFRTSIGLKTPFYKTPKFIVSVIIVPLIIAYVPYKISEIDSSQKIAKINTNLEEVKGLYKTDEEYSKYINEQEELNIELLKNFYGDSFQVFGQRNNHMFKNGAELKTKLKLDEYQLDITLSAEDLILGGEAIVFDGNTFSVKKSDIKMGRLFMLPGLGINGQTFAMVMLNKDWENPVYSIGVVTYE